MWTVALWILGLATAAAAITSTVLIIKRRNLRNKAILLPKYVLIALAPLTWGIGVMVAGQDLAGRDKAAAIMMLLLLLTVGSSFLGDIRKDL